MNVLFTVEAGFYSNPNEFKAPVFLTFLGTDFNDSWVRDWLMRDNQYPINIHASVVSDATMAVWDAQHAQYEASIELRYPEYPEDTID